ncbi:Exosome complex component RRP41-like-like protein [Drosera capensis]
MLYSDVGRLNCNVSYTTFATSVRGQGSDHKEYSSTLHKALEGAIILESFPKTTVDVFALVLESCGNDLPLVVSCASLALADAGIMMYDLVTAVSLSRHGPNLILDPLVEEESHQDGYIYALPGGSDPIDDHRRMVCHWNSRGRAPVPGMNLCLSACSRLGDVMRSCLKEAAAAATDDTNE